MNGWNSIPGYNDWCNRNYNTALPTLLHHWNNAPYGRDIRTGFMIGTSLLLSGETAKGNAFFTHLVNNYPLYPHEAAEIRRVWDTCRNAYNTYMPLEFNITIPYWATAGVSGAPKAVPALAINDGEAFRSETIKVLESLSNQEIQDRLFHPKDYLDGINTTRNRINSNFRVYSSDRFIIACSGRQTELDVKKIVQALNNGAQFFISHYHMREPIYLLTAYIVPTIDDLVNLARDIHKLELSQNMIGYFYRDDLSIAGVIPEGPFMGTLLHELFHLLVRDVFGDIPPWLDEGMASLYEQCDVQNNRLVGIKNWRQPILRAAFNNQQRPDLKDLIQMDWITFNRQAIDYHSENDFMNNSPYEVEKQAVNHAMARYFAFYLQEQNELQCVYNAFRNQFTACDVDRLCNNTANQSVSLLEQTLGSIANNINEIDQKFADWFLDLSA